METLACLDRTAFCPTSVENKQILVKKHDKVQDIRRKLKSGKYNLTEKLDAAVDKLLEDILVQKPQ